MEHGKNLKYALPVMLLFWLVFSMSSCVREELADEMGQADYSSVTINVQMPAPTVSTPMTRAGASDFDKMSDINILIAEERNDNSRILSRIYFRFAEVTDGQQIGGTTITYTDVEMNGTNVRQFKLNFSEEYFSSINGINLKTCHFYAVGNWGSEITENSAANVGALKDLEASSLESNPGIIAAPNVMFGESVEDGSEPIPGSANNEICRKIKIGLERTAAMITLVMEGSGLDQGIVITPRRISLHNVPNTCTIGRDNSVTTDFGGTVPRENAVTAEGEVKDGSTWTEGVNLIGTATREWSNFQDAARFNTTVGKHYADYSSENLSDQTVQPLFLYENIHGEGFGANETNQIYKRPAAAAGTSEQQINDVAGSCSYVEIEADYTRYSGNNMTVAKKGPVTWRFFLGEDVTSNFDVHRNTNYKLTLTLTGTGIGEGNASWRVESDLEEPILVGGNEMVVGGGAEMFCAEFADPTGNGNLKLDGSNDGFVYVYATKGNQAGWMNPSQTNGALKDESLGNQTWFYVAPLLPGGDQQPTEKTATIVFEENNGTPVVTLTFTQYRPLKVEVHRSDVEDETDEDMQEVKNLIETYYNYKFEEHDESDPFVIYVDRIDREAMPWGFDGVMLDHNHQSGFENVYHLIDPLDAEGNPSIEQNCAIHKEFAKNYLPTGKGWKEGNHVDYTRGSCMMHAAMENYFQQWGSGAPNITPSALLSVGLPSRPSKDGGNNTYGWCVPSIVGWQLLEKLDRHEKEHGNKIGIFDPKYPISKWTSYWTSNAGTADINTTYPKADGKTNAFVYQFDMGLDKIKQGEIYPGNLLLPRTTPLKYRLINIDPNYIKDVNDIEGGDQAPDPME